MSKSSCMMPQMDGYKLNQLTKFHCFISSKKKELIHLVCWSFTTPQFLGITIFLPCSC